MTHYDLKSDRSLQNSLRRGGRIMKWKGCTASMVPHMAELRLTVSAAAMGTVLMFGAGLGGTAPAMAGTCTETLPLGSGEFTCSGAAGGDVTQVLAGTPLTVTTEAGFEIATAVGNALEITGTDGASFEDVEASTIIGQENGIYITNLISGSLSVTSNGTVTGSDNGGIYAINALGTLDLTISSNVATGDYYGILALNDGTGALTITSTGSAIGYQFAGIEVENSGTDLSIDAVDTYGGAHGIRGSNDGSGELIITSTGTATGDESNGITARNNAGTNLTVDAVDTNGGQSGIFAYNQGTGALTITSTGTATGDTFNGITARNEITATDLSITAADATGLQNGIYAVNLGTTGALTITSTGTATGNTVDGIFALNYASGTNLTIDAADTSGYQHGIVAFNIGEGALTITSTGTATGTNAQGIGATNSANGTDLTINAADTSGGENGILAFNLGEGELSITSTGAATGDTADGIATSNSAEGTDLIVNAHDTTGRNNGILAFNAGTGALTITSTGTADGTLNSGIFAFNTADGDYLTVNAVDSIGGASGILALGNGEGALSITSTGTATGTNFYGIYGNNSADGTSLSITANDVTGGTFGIRGLNYGEAGLTITTTGDITGQSAAGVFAYNSANDVSASMTTYHAEGTTIIGATDGIYAENLGGSLTINALGTVTGEAGDGIDARNNGALTTDMTITSNVARGASHGIYALNNGTGALSITSTGTATGTGVNGITATNNGTDLTVNAVNTSGGDGPGLGGGNGIDADNNGTGALIINSNGTAIGIDFNGISANNSAAGTSLSITAAEVTGGTYGIRALNYGTAGLTISTTGDITGESQAGVFAYNSANDVSASMVIDQDAGTTITGATDGIYAENLGGSLTINALGTVIGLADDGIDARNLAGTTDMTITSSVAMGAANGILANNLGTGALTVTSTGTADGTNLNGIAAFNFVSGTDLTVNAANTSGGENGIYAINAGTGGALTITSTGTATGTLSDGIAASNSNSGTDLTVNAVSTSGVNGILANNLGTGALSINSTGTATGTLFNGIDALNSAFGTSLSITAAEVTGGANGIRALNFGTAGLTISTTGDVTGASQAGVFAYNSANDVSASMVIDQLEGTIITGETDGIYADNLGGSLTINALGTVIGLTDDGIDATNGVGTTGLTIVSNIASGANNGIAAVNEGTAGLTITSTGTATGTAGDGIFAVNSVIGTDLTVSVADSSGGSAGINASNNGGGAMTVTSTGIANGTLAYGINAFNSGTSMTIDAANSSGGATGIRAINNGTGALTISSTGAATGTNLNGISAGNAIGTDLTINAADTSGGQNGIEANNFGTGALTVTSAGTASGTTVNGINAANSAAGGALSVTAADATGGVDGISVLQEGTGTAAISTSGTVSGGTGNAITAVTTGSAITVNNSGTLESGVGFALAASGGVTDLTNSGTINGRVQLSAFDDATVNSGLFNATLDSDFGAGNDLFTNEGTVAVEGNIAFNGLEQFVNDGLIDMGNDAVGNSLTLAGDYTGSGDGSFAFDVTFDGAGSADTLIISGAATGNTLFEINDISTSPNFGNMVLVVDADAGTTEDAFALADESATIGFFAYSVFFDAPDNDFFLVNTIGTPVFQTLKFMEGAQSLWYRSADAWAAHMATQTDSSASPAWMQIYGTVTNQDDSSEFGTGGLTEPVSVNYEQDYFGLQLGYEFGSGVTGDGALFGFTGGYLNSNLGFDGTADNVRYNALNIGAYAGLKSGRFFANALAKYDFIAADVSARTAGYSADLDGAAYGVRLEAGYRWGDEKFFVQPLTSFEYQRASLDDFSALGADIDFDTFDGLRGMIGARLGGEAEIRGGNNLTYYLGGQAVHQSQTGDGLTFTSGDTSIEIENWLSKTFGRFELGLSIATRGGVTGFIEGNADISGDYTGYGGRGGLKVQF